MDQKEATLFQATKMFNWTEDEAKKLLFDGEELKEDYVEVLLDADKARVQKLKDERTKYHDTGFQKAEKQFKTFAEDKFKELTGFAGTEDNFEAMFKAWQETEKKKWQKNIEVTDDLVKKHPLFIQLESSSIPKAQFDELQRSFDEFKTVQQKTQVMGVVTSRAWDMVAAANPIQSDNPTVAENRKRDFLAKFSGYEYDLTDDNKIIVSKDGKRLENEHGNHVPFENFVMDLANMNYDFQAQGDKGNSGNKKGGEGSVVVITDKPTTRAEYNAAMAKWFGVAGDEAAKQRIAIKKYYDENKKD